MPEFIYTLQDLRKVVGTDRVILDDITLAFLPGAKIGVLGANGAGKSSLLRIMAGLDTEIVGEARPAPGIRIGYLPQEPSLDPSLDVLGNVEQGLASVRALLEEFEELSAKFAEPMDDDEMNALLEKQGALQDRIDAVGGWEFERTLEIAMDALRVPPGDAAVETLSGGEVRRVALCRLLLQQPDLLLLDEPTNHLDLQTLDWLEDFLADYEGSLVMVSHDRYFLDRTCNNILDVHNGHVKGYKGNYSAYLQQKELFMQTLEDRIAKAEKEVKRITGALQSMKRANKYDKSISQKHFMLMRQQRQLKWMKSLRPKRRKGLAFSLSSTDKSSLDVLELRNASLTFEGLESPLMNGVFAAVSRGQKIGIVGANGVGKTTLLRTLIGDVQLDGGEVEVQPGAEIGYFHQDHRTLDFNLTPVEQVQRLKPRMEYGDIRAMLGKFQLNKDQVETKLKSLSGGERARIALLKLLLEDNNLLLLDEPTNHLDTDAREAVEEAFKEYEGSIIIVSHDRWFLDAICDTIWHLPGDGSLNIYPGNYSHVFRK